MRFGCLDTHLHVCLLTLLAVWANNPSAAARCLKLKPEQTERHFYFQGESLAITLENSNRVSHKIVNHILRIILQEELGYAKVEIHGEYNSHNGTHILNRLSGCNATNGCEHGFTPGERVPETMVNLEIWLPAGFNMEPWVTAGHIIDAGPLGPYGRFGWYIPTSMVEKYWKDHHQIVDHWRAFKLDRVVSRLDLHPNHDIANMQLVKKVLTHRSLDVLGTDTFCTSQDCENGMWHNRQCRGKHKPCAVLLSSYEEVDMGLPQKQIKNLGLDIDMAWIGNRLERFVEQRTKAGKHTLFFSWTPDVLTATGNYTRVKFPSCKSSQLRPTNCDFTVNQLGKAMWMKMRTHTPEVHQIIVNMQFTQEQYEDLLQLYMDSRQDVEDTACDWIKANRNVWSKWLPNMESKPNIFIGGMYPIREGRRMNAPGILPAVAMAIKIINKKEKSTD